LPRWTSRVQIPSPALQHKKHRSCKGLRSVSSARFPPVAHCASGSGVATADPRRSDHAVCGTRWPLASPGQKQARHRPVVAARTEHIPRPGWRRLAASVLLVATLSENRAGFAILAGDSSAAFGNQLAMCGTGPLADDDDGQEDVARVAPAWRRPVSEWLASAVFWNPNPATGRNRFADRGHECNPLISAIDLPRGWTRNACPLRGN
jgi:hypothetical protein